MHYYLLANLTPTAILEGWADRLLAASWQGGLILILAWSVCHFCKRISAGTKCWIWRIAYLKFALMMLFGGLLALPVLQPTPSTNITSSATSLSSASLDPTSIQNFRSDAEFPLEVADSPMGLTSTTSWTHWIFIAWLIGVGIGSMIVGHQYYTANRLSRRCLKIKNKEIRNLYRVLCSQLKISKTPRLAMTQAVSTPMIVGAIRPTILIPRAMAMSFKSDEIRMILAHELGHAKRRDLVWNWLIVAVRTVFFFHPLVWLTQSRIALDQEIACDQLALNTTNSNLQEYGNLIVRCSASTSRGATRNLAMVGAVSSFKTLKERILEMNRINQNQTSSGWLSIAAIVTGFALLVPVQLVAQQGNDQAKSTASSTQKQSESNSRQSRATTASSGSNTQSDGRNQRRNVNVSVSSDGLDESIKVLWKNNRVAVTYGTNASGSKKIKKYSLDNIDELEQQNAAAYRFYKKHVSASNNAVVTAVGQGAPATAARQWVAGQRIKDGMDLPAGFRPSSTQSVPEEYRTEEPQQRQWSGMMSGASASSSSSAGSSSSGSGRNGQNQTQGSRSSASVSAGSFDQLIEQVKTMMSETDDPAKRQSLQAMLDHLESQSRPRARGRR